MQHRLSSHVSYHATSAHMCVYCSFTMRAPVFADKVVTSVTVLRKTPKFAPCKTFPLYCILHFNVQKSVMILWKYKSVMLVHVVHHLVSISFRTSAILFSEWDGLFGYRTIGPMKAYNLVLIIITELSKPKCSSFWFMLSYNMAVV